MEEWITRNLLGAPEPRQVCAKSSQHSQTLQGSLQVLGDDVMGRTISWTLHSRALDD